MSTHEAARKAREKYEQKYKRVTLRIPICQYQQLTAKYGGNPHHAIAGAFSEAIERLTNCGVSERQQLIEKVGRLEAQISVLTNNHETQSLALSSGESVRTDAIAASAIALDLPDEAEIDNDLTDALFEEA